MNHLKVCVYAICKDEEKFINRWYQAVSMADCIVVVDTGSKDHSLELLRRLPIAVYERKIVPFRFDTARNEAYRLIPEDIDICVSLDLDEVISPDWYTQLTAQWTPSTTAASCRFVWRYDETGREDGVFWPIRIHARHHYIWTHAVHEVLTYTGTSPESVLPLHTVQISHLPDPLKPRDYLPMLEQAVKDSPADARDLFYLGREYLYHGEWALSLKTFTTYLALPYYWREERCTVLRYMAKAFLQLKQETQAVTSLQRAITVCPSMREPFIELAFLYYKQANWQQTAYYIDQALKITAPSQRFVNEGFAWDATPYDIGCTAHFHLQHYALSLAYAIKCVSYLPNEARFLDNVHFITDYIITHALSSSKSTP